MSAPSIPNLLTMRGGAHGRGGRAPGRDRGGDGPGRNGISGSHAGPNQDATIQGTDSDAAVSRLSAVELGYLSDPYAHLFVHGPPTRRQPIINRGTYTRSTSIDILVDRFLTSTPDDEPRQIISLGAGTDTRCLRVFTSPKKHRNVLYHEIDFPTVMAAKQSLLTSNPTLQALLSAPTQISATVSQCKSLVDPAHHNTLTLHGLDLRTITPTSAPLPTLIPSAPTLLLSECCLCYLPAATSTALLSHFTSLLPLLGIIIYEPVHPGDAFGKTMVANLAARGIEMPTLEVYPTPADQETRLRGAGFDEVRSRTVDQIWEGWTTPAERERVDALEGGLDEIEEWRLLAGHYVVAWGWRGGTPKDGDDDWGGWEAEGGPQGSSA